MEEKKIRLLESSENALLGQLAVFNWKLKDKKPAKKMGPFKTNEYTFEREETHPNKEAEKQWEELFQQWNEEYMFKKYPRYLIFDLICLLVFIGFLVPALFGLPDVWIFICVAGMALSLIGMIVIMILITINMSKVGKMDAITRQVRDEDLLKKNKEGEKEGE